MESPQTFIGVDLAWRSDRNHTGAAVLVGSRQDASLHCVSNSVATLDGVRAFLSANTAVGDVFVAIDAPLIIPNAIGQRRCEQEISQRYGSRDASCHTSNQRLYPNAPSVALANDLILAGFIHAPSATEGSNRVLLEVYPHAAMVALFDLPKILKYKKGTMAQKRQGLGELITLIRRLMRARPRIRWNDRLEQLLSRDLSLLPAPQLKAHEDILDAVFCAYLAYYFWYWGMERHETFGSVIDGYILNPRLSPDGLT